MTGRNLETKKKLVLVYSMTKLGIALPAWGEYFAMCTLGCPTLEKVTNSYVLLQIPIGMTLRFPKHLGLTF